MFGWFKKKVKCDDCGCKTTIAYDSHREVEYSNYTSKLNPAIEHIRLCFSCNTTKILMELLLKDKK